MEKDLFSQYLIKPAVMALIVGGGAAFLRPGAAVIIPGGRDVSLPVVVAGATFVAAEISQLINVYLFPQIPQISILSAPLHTALAVGVQTASCAAIENYLSPGLVSDLGLTELVAFAALSEVTSTYIVDQWIDPMRHSWMQN